MRIVGPDSEGLAQAVAALRSGAVVAYPTETVYGLAVDPFRESAIQRLFEVKGRQEDNPILVVISDESQLLELAGEISARARAYMDAFWPGPLSLLFPKAAGLPSALTAQGDKICVRCPAHETARALCRAFGGALTSSSANRSDEAPARSVETAALPGVAVGIDGGVLPESLPSTVFDPDGNQVIREGCIPRSRLLQVAERLG